jgi:hypothetical protein
MCTIIIYQESLHAAKEQCCGGGDSSSTAKALTSSLSVVMLGRWRDGATNQLRQTNCDLRQTNCQGSTFELDLPSMRVSSLPYELELKGTVGKVFARHLYLT